MRGKWTLIPNRDEIKSYSKQEIVPDTDKKKHICITTPLICPLIKSSNSKKKN